VGDTLKVFEDVNPAWRGVERYSGRAVLCYLVPTEPYCEVKEKQKDKGREGTAVWAMINQDGSLGSIKVYLNVSYSQLQLRACKLTTEISGDIPDISSSGHHIGLSHHLTSLDLSLPELLVRPPLPHGESMLRVSIGYPTWRAWLDNHASTALGI
jgi:hypothetical protein